MPISLKFNFENLLKENTNDLPLEFLEPLLEIDGHLNYKIIQTDNEKIIKEIMNSCPNAQKENLFEYLLFSHIKSYYPHLVIETFNQLDKASYLNEKSTLFILSHIRENKHFPLLEHFYPFFSPTEKPLVAEKLNHLVLSQVFSSYQKDELQPLLNFIQKEHINYDVDIANNYLVFLNSNQGVFVSRFIQNALNLHHALSHFSNQGFNFYLDLFSKQKHLIFYSQYTKNEKILLMNACGADKFSNDYDILVALHKTQTMNFELNLLEKNVTTNIKTGNKIKI